MANGLFSRLCHAFQTFEHAIDIIFGRGFPPGTLYAIESSSVMSRLQPITFPGQSFKDTLNDAFLWAVPTKRRTIEKRLCKRFGVPKYIWKPLVPKTNIIMCKNCGNNHEAGLLCSHCYEIIKKETKEIQEAIQKELGLNPVEQDVVVLYEGENTEKLDEFWKRQRIVELPKKRPEWFNQNLLQSSANELTDESGVKVKDKS